MDKKRYFNNGVFDRNSDKDNLSRRSFVKKATVATIGNAMVNSFPISAYASMKSSVSSLKIGLIGCGNRGSGAVLEALKSNPNVKLVAMGDTFEDSIKKSFQSLKSTFNNQVAVPNENRYVGFDSYQKVIDKCDAVILATPPPFRPSHFEAAVNANKHVFMEKPLFVDMSGYHDIMKTNEVAIKKNLSVVVGLQSRYNAGLQEMIDQIKDGTIGRIVSLNAYYNISMPKIHYREPGQTEMSYQLKNWRYFTWLWGGQLAGQAIHQIDVMNWIMDDYPVSVNGLGGRQVFFGPEQGNTYDHHYAEFEYSNRVKLHVQSRNMDNTWHKTGFTVIGTKGSADERSRIFDVDGKMIWRYHSKDEVMGNSEKCQYAFIHSILNNKNLNHVEYGAKSTLTTIMGRMAIHSGKVITLAQVLASKRSILPKEFSWNADMPDKPQLNGNYPIPVPGKTDVF